MEILYNLVQSLTTSELETINEALNQSYSDNKKGVQLFKLLKKRRHAPSNEDACKILYGRREKAFYKVKYRLKNKILDALIQETNIEKVNDLLDIDLSSVRLKKKLVNINYIFLTKGTLPIVFQLLDEIINEANEYASYTNLIEAIRLKRSFALLRASNEEVLKLSEQLSFAKLCEDCVQLATDYYYELIRKEEFKGQPEKKDLQAILLNAIEDLNEKYKLTRSPRVGYYLRRLEIAYYSNEGKHEVAKEACNDLLKIQKHKAIYRKERDGFVYDNLGQLEVKLNNYKNAFSYFKLAQGHYNIGSINITMSREQEFLAAFYADDLTTAVDALDFILTNMPEDQGEFRTSKFKYYKAAYFFKKKQFAESFKILKHRLELTEDKAGWDVATRILSIMSNIELGYTEQASMETVSLQKHFERASKKEDITLRNKHILKTLLVLEKNNFLWSSISLNRLKSLGILSGADPVIAWKPLTPELIPFHEWFLEKLNPSVRNKVLEKTKREKVLVKVK